MYTVRYSLKMSNHQRAIADKRFLHVWRIHNQLVKVANKRINLLKYDRSFIDVVKEYKKIMAQDNPDLARLKLLHESMNKRRNDIGLTKNGLEKYILIMGRTVRNYVSSQQVQKEADRVWKGVESILFGNGKSLRYKKYEDIRSISSKSLNGCKLYLENDIYKVNWLGMRLDVVMDMSNLYTQNVILNLSRLKYCEIIRLQFSSGWKYYVNLVIDATAPDRIVPGNETIGIDPGIATVAYVCNSYVGLEELAPRYKNYNHELQRVRRAMNMSRRTNNPNNFNIDGTICQGSLQWKNSRNYDRLHRKLRMLCRKKSSYTLYKHREIGNRILALGNKVIIEPTDFAGMAKKRNLSERHNIEGQVVGKKDKRRCVKTIKRRRRFGKSINNRSPGLFVKLLRDKVAKYNGIWYEIDTIKVKASQYRHDTGGYEKVPLSQRTKTINSKTVYRDPYSAYVIMNTNPVTNETDRNACISGFSNFLKNQKELVMRYAGKPHPVSFGF